MRQRNSSDIDKIRKAAEDKADELTRAARLEVKSLHESQKTSTEALDAAAETRRRELL